MPVMAGRRSRSAGSSAPRDWIRDFRLLMAGSFVSMLGSRISTIACPLLALFLTSSPFDAGFVAFAATVPSVLVYIPAGALVDRWDPRRTMLVCESGRGVAIAAVAVSFAFGRPSVALLIPVVIVEEILEVFSTLADRRCVRDLVPWDRAASAQSSIETRAHVVVLAGRPLGVFLFGLQPILPFLADAMSFVVSVSSIVSLKVKHVVPPRPRRISRRQLRHDIVVALNWLTKDGYACAALALSAGTTLIGQALIMVFLAGARASGLSSAWVGLVLAASGVGGVLGALSAPWSRKLPRVSLILLQMLTWVAALMFLAVWGSQSFLCMAIVMAMQSLTGALGNIEMDTYLIRSCDKNMLARVTSFGRLIAFSASAVGPLLGGLLFEIYGARNAVFALATITSILTLIAFFVPSMLNPPKLVKSAVLSLPKPWTVVARIWCVTVIDLRFARTVFVDGAAALRKAMACGLQVMAIAVQGTNSGRLICYRDGSDAERMWICDSKVRPILGTFNARPEAISVPQSSTLPWRAVIFCTGNWAGRVRDLHESVELRMVMGVLAAHQPMTSAAIPGKTAAGDLRNGVPRELTSADRLVNAAATIGVPRCPAPLRRRLLAASAEESFAGPLYGRAHGQPQFVDELVG